MPNSDGSMTDTELAAAVQAKYGSSQFGNLQAIRYVYYSKQTYAQAGQTSLSFFGDVVGQNGVTDATTNMTRANSFSQRMFLIRAIRCQFSMAASTIAATSVANTYLGCVHDIANSASFLRFAIQDKEYLKVAQPLVYMPMAGGVADVAITGGSSANIEAYGNPGTHLGDAYVLDPPQLIEAEVVFSLTMNWQAAVAIGASTTGVVTVYLDGILFRPVQ